MRLATLAAIVLALVVGVGADKPSKSPRPKYDEVVAENEKLSARVIQLEGELKIARNELKAIKEELRVAQAAAPPPTPDIQAAIKERRLAVGMTLAQANEALHAKGVLIEEGGTDQTYQWSVDYLLDGDRRKEKHVASFENGRLTRHWQ